MSEFQGSDGQWELVEVGTTIKRLVPASDGESLRRMKRKEKLSRRWQ